MSDQRLPRQPRGATEQYLAAILDELVGIRALLRGTVEVVTVSDDYTDRIADAVQRGTGKPQDPDEANPNLIANIEPKRTRKPKAGSS